MGRCPSPCWYGRGKIASAPYAGVPAPVCRTLYCAQLAGPGPVTVCRIASSTRLRQLLGHLAGHSLSVGQWLPRRVAFRALSLPLCAHYHCLASPRAVQVGPATGPAWGRESRRLLPAGCRRAVPSQPASGPTRAAGGNSDDRTQTLLAGSLAKSDSDARTGEQAGAGSGHDLCHVRS